MSSVMFIDFDVAMVTLKGRVFFFSENGKSLIQMKKNYYSLGNISVHLLVLITFLLISVLS